MAKSKLLYFEILAHLNESKKLLDFLQKLGVTEIEDAAHEELIKYKTDETVNEYLRKSRICEKAFRILERYCEINKSLIQKFTDYREIEYSEYKLISDKNEEIFEVCESLIEAESKILQLKKEISREKSNIDYYSSWKSLDIPLGSKRTMSTSIFVGSFKRQLTKERIFSLIEERDSELIDVEIEIVHTEKMLTNSVLMCHNSHGNKLQSILSEIGFYCPQKLPMMTPQKALEECEKNISALKDKIEDTENEINHFKDRYESVRFLYDYYTAQAEKYKAVENTGVTESTVYICGYVPEKYADEVKFEVERQFAAHMELSKPDYEYSDVPVLIENRSFAAGVESITNMYSPPSNKDVDPNPVMSFLYYAFWNIYNASSLAVYILGSSHPIYFAYFSNFSFSNSIS